MSVENSDLLQNIFIFLKKRKKELLTILIMLVFIKLPGLFITILPILLLILLLVCLKKYPFQFLVLTMLIFIILHITNPTEEMFLQYYSNELNELKKDSGLLEKLALEGIKFQGKHTIQRENMYIFSIYSIKMLDEEYVFLGIGDNFIELD